MEARGVLNSWETFEIKSPLSVSVPASSSAILLKFCASMLYSGSDGSLTLTLKLPFAISAAAALRSRIGCIMLRLMNAVIMVPITIQTIKAMMTTRFTTQ